MVAWKFPSLDAKPGKEWTAEEFADVRDWWMEPVQMRLIWHYASRYLGRVATREDVEDAVVDFFMVLERARDSFKPSSISFPKYVICVCFKHHCMRSAQRLLKRRQEELPLNRTGQEGEEFVLELIDVAESNDPFQRARNEAFLRDIATFLTSGRLSENQKRAFRLRFLEGFSYDEAAAQMNVPVGSVKGWIHRATRAARVYMEERGWNE